MQQRMQGCGSLLPVEIQQQVAAAPYGFVIFSIFPDLAHSPRTRTDLRPSHEPTPEILAPAKYEIVKKWGIPH